MILRTPPSVPAPSSSVPLLVSPASLLWSFQLRADSGVFSLPSASSLLLAAWATLLSTFHVQLRAFVFGQPPLLSAVYPFPPSSSALLPTSALTPPQQLFSSLPSPPLVSYVLLPVHRASWLSCSKQFTSLGFHGDLVLLTPSFVEQLSSAFRLCLGMLAFWPP